MPIPRHVLELAPDTGAVVRALDLPGGDEVGWFALDRLALGRSALWAIGADDHLLRIDPRGGTVRPSCRARGVRRRRRRRRRLGADRGPQEQGRGARVGGGARD